MEHEDPLIPFQNRIDDYLQNRLSATEKVQFEAEVAQNAHLKEAVHTERQIMLGFQKNERNKLKKKLQGFHQTMQTEQEKAPRIVHFWQKSVFQWAAAAAVLLAVLGLWYQNNSNGRVAAEVLYVLAEVPSVVKNESSLGFAGTSADTLNKPIYLYKPLSKSTLAYNWAQDTLCLYTKDLKGFLLLEIPATDQKLLIQGQDTFDLERVSQTTVLK